VSIYETSRLRVRPLAIEDAPFILELLNDPDWIRFIGDRDVHSLADAEAYLRNGPIKLQAEHGFSLDAVERRDGPGVVVGMCGLIRRKELADVDLGFAFLPAARGRGFATEAAAAALARAFTHHGLRRVVAITDPVNVASGNVLMRIGMRYEGLVPFADEQVGFYAAERA
jgi:[ribosomal protein S5]-alanine N-acetyltransferase